MMSHRIAAEPGYWGLVNYFENVLFLATRPKPDSSVTVMSPKWAKQYDQNDQQIHQAV